MSISEIPEDIRKYYENYYSFGPVGEKDRFIRRLAKKCLFKNFFPGLSRLILNTSDDQAHIAVARQKLPKDARILDVGCGTGQLVYEMKNHGFENVQGIDPFLDHDIEHANGSKVYKKDIFEIEGKWDVIMLHHVFEHMDQPLEILKRINYLLNPEGLAIIRIPNVDSYAARKYKYDWQGIQPPVHYVMPSMKQMKKISVEAGFIVEEVLGENVLEFWLISLAYQLGVWDYDELGARAFYKNKKKLKNFPLACKKEISILKAMNKHVLKTPSLCEWITYYLRNDRR